MNRNEAIEQAASELLIEINAIGVAPPQKLDALRNALAMPKDAEPVAWMMTADGYRRPPEFYRAKPDFVPPISKLTPLYTHPPKDAEPKRHRWDKDGERCKDCGDKDWTATAVCHPPKADAERGTYTGVGTVSNVLYNGGVVVEWHTNQRTICGKTLYIKCCEPKAEAERVALLERVMKWKSLANRGEAEDIDDLLEAVQDFLKGGR
jgi:hypothetical protein